jgi:peptidyl-prolyl cis-trans isomerase B (cyclophilin B)
MDRPLVMIETSLGEITLELDPEKAPLSVENFLQYVNSDFYKGLIFHRVIKDFVIQGGGMTFALKEKPGWGTVKNEAGNGLKNLRGTVAMARAPEPHSASCQFYVNLADNADLDHVDDTDEGYGYAVFGQVIDGMDVVDAIGAVPTESRQGFDDVPVKSVTIKAVVQV